jgi:hypothetical protein
MDKLKDIALIFILLIFVFGGIVFMIVELSNIADDYRASIVRDTVAALHQQEKP